MFFVCCAFLGFTMSVTILLWLWEWFKNRKNVKIVKPVLLAVACTSWGHVCLFLACNVVVFLIFFTVIVVLVLVFYGRLESGVLRGRCLFWVQLMV